MGTFAKMLMRIRVLGIGEHIPKGKLFTTQVCVITFFVAFAIFVWFSGYQTFRPNYTRTTYDETEDMEIVVMDWNDTMSVSSITSRTAPTTTSITTDTTTSTPSPQTTTTKRIISPEPPHVPPPSAPNPPPSPKQLATSNIRPGNDNIFFIESSCVFDHRRRSSGDIGGLVLNPRQTCAVYSAAVVHPERPVYLYHTCPLSADYYDKSSEVVKRLLELPNVGIVQMSSDPADWFLETPIEGLAANMSKSKFPVEHASDSLRMLLLWKYGGTYLDLDVIVLKNLSQLGENWASAEAERILSNGIIDFDRAGPGHKLVEAILKKMKGRYDPNYWSGIGPVLVSEVMMQECNISIELDFRKMGHMPCGFTILPSEILYPLHYSRYPDMFKPDAWDSVAEVLGRAYTTHAWNKLSSGDKAPPGCPYVRLAQTYCPLVYEASNGNF